MEKTERAKYDKEQSEEINTHFSYSDYRKKVKKTPYKDITIFISVLVIGILIFLGFAKILSPNVDVEIGDKDDYLQYEDENQQRTIDERLKHLQAEDDANAKADDDALFTPELDEAVVLPSKIKKTIGEMETEMLNDNEQKEKVEAPSEKKVEEKENKIPAVKQETKAPEPNHSQSSYRVVVGSYATDKQAEVAKSIMQDAGIGVSPIIKNIGGVYTLQIGVFSTKEKAQQSVNNLLKNNFPARLVE